jgi:hypothetical protein
VVVRLSQPAGTPATTGLCIWTFRCDIIILEERC